MNALLAQARALTLKKSYSQNFLINEGALNRIVESLALESQDIVLEIGAGAGFLTERLLPKAKEIIAVELDPHMIQYLQRKFSSQSKLTLIHHDILKFPFESIEAPRFKIIGNLPYNITSPILFKLVGELSMVHYPLRQRIQQATLMVQKEVGERITAQPGRKAYNPLSIAVQYWFQPQAEFIVPARDFYPAPKVDSMVISLTPREKPLLEIQDLDFMARLIDAAFHQRRKTLKNALGHAHLMDPALLETLFRETGINPGLRAEALPIEAFGAMANAYTQHTR